MLKRKAEVFSPTDGVLYATIDTDARAARGADFSDPELLDAVWPLPYRRLRISARDVELAESTGCAVTAKVETRAAVNLTPEIDVIFDDGVYEITRIERRGHTRWLWLSEILTDGYVDLTPAGVQRDAHGIPVAGSATPVRVWCRRQAPSTRRVTADGIDALRPALTLRLRSTDYLGESQLKRGGIDYSVVATESHGQWIDLTCERKVSDR